MNNSTGRGLVNWYAPREAPAIDYDARAGPVNPWRPSHDLITIGQMNRVVAPPTPGYTGPAQMNRVVAPPTPGFIGRPGQMNRVVAPPTPGLTGPSWQMNQMVGLRGQRNSQENSRLTRDDRQKKFRKEIYNPAPKRITRRLSLYYRDNAKTNNLNEVAKEDTEEEDGNRCPICWDDFEAREEVTLTPCNHMFHEGCIMPWVNTNTHCPVCRHAFGDQIKETTSSNLNNNNNIISYAATTGITAADLIYIITAMDEALQWG